MSNIVKFDKEFLMLSKDIELPWRIDTSRGRIISDTTVDTSRRWEDTQELIFELDGKTYRTYYDQGKTEYQDTLPWDYEKEISCQEVHQVEKVVKVWEPIK